MEKGTESPDQNAGKKRVTIKNNPDMFQRTITVEIKAWKETEGIPGGRTKAINEFLKQLAASRYSELQALLKEIAEEEAEVIRLNSSLAFKRERVAVLQEEERKKKKEAERAPGTPQNKIEAAKECYRLSKLFRGLWTQENYDRLEQLSGIPFEKIKEFLDSKEGSPTEVEAQRFFTS